MVEDTLSIMLVGLTVVAALNTLAASRLAAQTNLDRQRGLYLGEDLLAEILQQAYEDPTAGPGSFGVGADENTGTRSKFEDVDDYDGWNESPPQHKDGTVIPNFTGWRRTVSVAWVDAINYSQTSTTDTRHKRIIVTMSHNGRVAATLTALRSAWSAAAP
jgi:hypothetical protein